MRKLGTALHISRSGNIIVKIEVEHPPPIGSRVFDKNLRKLGTLTDLIGPVSSPYAVVKPESSEVKLFFEPGPVYYTLPKRKPTRRKVRRRKKK